MKEIKFQAQLTSFKIKTEKRLKSPIYQHTLKEVKKPTKKRLEAQHIISKQIEFKLSLY